LQPALIVPIPPRGKLETTMSKKIVKQSKRIGIDELITKIQIRMSEILLSFIVVLVFAAALLRRFGFPLVWSVDLAQLLFVWICFIGADIAMQKDRHIGVDLLTNLMPAGLQKGVKLGGCVLAIGFLSLIAVFGTYLAIINTKRQFAGMELSYSWATASAPVGCLLMIRTLVKKIVRLLRGTGIGKEAV
jgi:TRAP-type C4-dicarboxylate transport system permease small subunit